MENIDYKTRKIQEEYVNNKGVTKIRTIREEYTETSTYYYEKDEKGSITKITDKDGTTIEQYLYDAYGTPYTKTQSGETVIISNLKPSLIGNTRLYTGREYDRGLQLYYNRARYYNPQLGRFISRDPIDISDDVNLYTYVGNNPVMFVDRMGTDGKSIILTISFFDDDQYLDFREGLGQGIIQNSKIINENAHSKDELNKILDKYYGSNVKGIIFASHGNAGAIKLGEEQLSIQSIKNDYKFINNYNKLDYIILASCSTAENGGETFSYDSNGDKYYYNVKNSDGSDSSYAKELSNYVNEQGKDINIIAPDGYYYPHLDRINMVSDGNIISFPSGRSIRTDKSIFDFELIHKAY